MTKQPRPTNPEQGSIFFYLLIGAALIALLSIVIANGGNWGQDKLSDDKARLIAAEILTQMNTMKEAVDRTTLKGATWSTVSLDNPIVSGYSNTNCTSASCKVFDPAGGGAEWMFPPTGASLGDYQYIYVSDLLIYAYGNDRNDLLVLLYDVPENVCRHINVIANKSKYSDAIEYEAASFWAHRLYDGNVLTAGAYPSMSNLFGCKQFHDINSRFITRNDTNAAVGATNLAGDKYAVWGTLRLNKD